ncbi:MAG: bifunctional phosphoribosylaminoimidazolecarboxamide formyltransferase/IMP cyclohydrolase [Bacteroidetes bacterium GWE2_29_8]|nr:MAG: bifunctional phosphoribosylaminoimidazolecarboxamide formyltransferase/IMP cyclohydrolase [Bacteroidetes bacterium GWE2_29_8]OFY22843.1 MAG: bifunctional phosphoribosylaminoimidazolecarboxamide formyltransferase/IMP cyclohydrolase [Bacteroidetes bacterium GWF2_29_10]
MESKRQIKSALISVYHKDNLENIVRKLNKSGIQIYSTGGTQNFINSIGIESISVESLTGYPSILGGRVKTLHPKIFGGILGRRDCEKDKEELSDYIIPEIDLVITDLYPFEKTVESNASADEIIEKIDIGGISLIRAAAKNYNDVVIISSIEQYGLLEEIIDNGAITTIEQRRMLASMAFNVSSSYDAAIFNYFNRDGLINAFKRDFTKVNELRYGENPHQKGYFYGDLDKMFDKLNGKELSYNNLIDIDAAINLINDFEEPTIAIIKHNNACGIASGDNIVKVWEKALAGDPISAFGGIIICNNNIDIDVANEINKIFFEILIAPNYTLEAIDLLKQKKNRIILKQKTNNSDKVQFRSALNGVLLQEIDLKKEISEDLKVVTRVTPNAREIEDLLFANKLVKHTKSNAIILVKDKQMIGSGMGQTSRVDALKQAINKAKAFKFTLEGAVMASDAFFPFADCVEIAHEVGIECVIHPGGSIRDEDSINYCNDNAMKMVITGFRHFKH